MPLYVPSPTAVVAKSAAAFTVSATTVKTTMATITIPAGMMQANSVIDIVYAFTITGATSWKQVLIDFGGTSYTDIQVSPGVGLYRGICQVANRNSLSSQVGGQGTTGSFLGIGTTTAAVVTSAVNTANAVTMLITGQCGSASDSIRLEHYHVNLLR